MAMSRDDILATSFTPIDSRVRRRLARLSDSVKRLMVAVTQELLILVVRHLLPQR